jgi:hypothetical protein
VDGRRRQDRPPGQEHKTSPNLSLHKLFL